MASRRLLPRSTRLRVALVAAVTSAVVLAAGSYWFVHTLRDDLRAAADQLAGQRLALVLALLDDGVRPAVVAERIDDGAFMIAPAVGDCPPANTAVPTAVGTVAVYGPDCVIGYPFNPPGAELRDGPSRDGRYTAAASANPDPVGLATVDTAERVLWVVVPVTALLIGAAAWFAVRRSLRAVEGIRVEVEDVRAQDLGRRVPVPDSGDEITRLADTMNDMLARLDRSVRRQSQFTADASHELRTPLASMRTQLEVLLTYPDRIDWRTTCANTVLDVARAQELVADLLLLSALDAPGGQPSEPVAVADLVREHLSGRTPHPSLALAARFAGSPVVTGHRARLDRVLRNLIDNAEQHAVREVTVAVATDRTDCVLVVQDDGPGVPAADRERIFERFVRLDDDRSRGGSDRSSDSSGGSGLGLAIAAEIAREHRGTLAVTDSDSTGSDSGARFELRIPLR